MLPVTEFRTYLSRSELRVRLKQWFDGMPSTEECIMALTALVTGAYRGIGLEIALQLLKRDVRVIVSARDGAKSEEACEMLGVDRSMAMPVVLDVTNSQSVQSAVASAQSQFGGIDILVNNAAILIDGPGGFDSKLADLTADTIRRTFETNVVGPSRVTQAVLPGMIARGFGRIVNVSSRAGQLADMQSGFPAYRMSKAALNALTRITAAEVAKEHPAVDVKINAACPGWCRTDMGGAEAERSASEGAKTPVWLALLGQDGPSGEFFHDCQRIEW
jgi:NAD(P)-dependent dehydrogenase (short-subunit alcohol dehydrogenase family)